MGQLWRHSRRRCRKFLAALDGRSWTPAEACVAGKSIVILAKTNRSGQANCKGGRAQLKWDIKGLKSAVSVDGTVNDAKDKDKRWIVEIAIPFASLATEDVQPVMPADGSEWRINFSRVNWQHEVGQDGRYSRKRNTKTGKIIPEYNWVWSPQGIINMHYPEYWGKLLFRDESAGKAR